MYSNMTLYMLLGQTV